MHRHAAWFGFAAMCVGAWAQRTLPPPGIFEGHADVGDVLHPGSAEYDAPSKSYTIVGSGENMWFGKDEFHFVWKQVSGDFTFDADIAFSETGGNAHKKAVLMARQSLALDSAYADVAVHGDGLTSLQARESTGAATHEVGINSAHPHSVRLEKHGEYFYMSLAGPGEELKFAGGSMRVPLKAPFYIGIGVCAHDKDAIAKAVFSNVKLTAGSAKSGGEVRRFSTLETISVASTDRRVVRVDAAPAQEADASAPRDGDSYPSSDEFVNCFPRVSPDGSQVAVLSYEHGTVGCPAGKEVLLRLISPGKNPRALTSLVGGPGTLGSAPWSSDGKSLVFVSGQAIPR